MLDLMPEPPPAPPLPDCFCQFPLPIPWSLIPGVSPGWPIVGHWARPPGSSKPGAPVGGKAGFLGDALHLPHAQLALRRSGDEQGLVWLRPPRVLSAPNCRHPLEGLVQPL